MATKTAKPEQAVKGLMAIETRIIELATERNLGGLRFEWNDGLDFGHLEDPVPLSIFAPRGKTAAPVVWAGPHRQGRSAVHTPAGRGGTVGFADRRRPCVRILQPHSRLGGEVADVRRQQRARHHIVAPGEQLRLDRLHRRIGELA